MLKAEENSQHKLFTMKFSESLKKNSDFRRVYRKGHSKADSLFVLYVLPNDLNENRIGISVSKKVGNSVVRHHITRLVRESYRLNEDSFICGYDLVLVARPYARSKSFYQVSSSLLSLMRYHHLLLEQAL